MELVDPQSLFGLHAQLYSLAEILQLPLPRIWAYIRGRYNRSAKIDDIFL
jgi:hypothetical protein